MYNFEPYNVLLVITINIAVLLMTAFVLQGHNFSFYLFYLQFFIVHYKNLNQSTVGIF